MHGAQVTLKVTCQFRNLQQGHPRHDATACACAQAAGHQEGVRQLQLEHAKQASKMRQEVAAGAHAAADRYERRMRAAADEADARRRAETGWIEEARGRARAGAGLIWL